MDWSAVISGVSQAVLPIFLAGLAWLSAKIATWINAKVSNERIAGILARLDDAAFSIVRELMQTTVDAAKASGGKLPAEVATAAKDAAVAKLRSYLGKDGIAMLMRVLGFVEEAQATAFLATKIEATVHAVKSESATADPAGQLAAAFGGAK